MTASSIHTQFRLTLLRVGECLTENDVQNLAFLCDGIKPACRELLRNARDLFIELQGRDLLNERNVDVLSGWLEELNLFDALKPLRKYSEEFLPSTSQQQNKCIEHEDQALKYFCVTCESKVCPECVIHLHDRSSHDVIVLANTTAEVSKRRDQLDEEIKAISERSKTLQENWNEKKDFFSSCRERIRKQIQKDTILIHENAEKNKLSLLKRLDEKEVSDLKNLMKEREDIESAVARLSNVKEEMKEISSDSLSGLRKFCKLKRNLTVIQGRVQSQEAEVKKKCVDLLYKRVPNDGLCGKLTLCKLIGGVILLENQIVHVLDERRESGGVRLVCFNPKDPNKEYWRHLVTVDDNLSPVVMSGIVLLYNCRYHFLFALGNRVFEVNPHWSGYLNDYVESVSTLVIDDVEEGAWITSIMPYKSAGKEYEEFFVSVSNSTLLRAYRISGEALRIVETNEHVSSVISAGYVPGTFAIISRGRDDVIIVTVDNTVKQSGLINPPSFSSGQLPICVTWDGAFWLVLFVSDGIERKWNVSSYRKTGKFKKVCVEGTSCCDLDVPVSVTRCKSTGFVSFADNTVKTFQH